MTLLGRGGEVKEAFKRLTVSTMDPHTTRKEVRTCKECHTDPRALGLGRGSVDFVGGSWQFTSALKPSVPSGGKGLLHALDSFVQIDGKPLVKFSRPDVLRTFDASEIKAVLTVGLCLECHSSLSLPNIEPISFQDVKAIPCRKLKRLIKR